MRPPIESARALFDAAKSGTASDLTVERLLDCFYAGFDIENLVTLLQSDNTLVVRQGSWILSELGSRASAALEECCRLLAHHDKTVRFFALDAVLVNATASDKELICQALQLVQDSDTGVQWKCLNLVRRMSFEQLQAATSANCPCWIDDHLNWLIIQITSPSIDDMRRRSESHQVLDRAFAAVAAARVGPVCAEILRLISTESDAAGRFAKDELDDLISRGAARPPSPTR